MNIHKALHKDIKSVVKYLARHWSVFVSYSEHELFVNTSLMQNDWQYLELATILMIEN